MRIGHLPLVLLTFLVACGSTPPPKKAAPRPDPALDRSALLASASILFRTTGSLEAEALLAAAGPEAVPFLRPLLDAEDPDIRWRTLGLLLDAGEPIGLDAAEEVDLILFDLTRREVWAYASLRALGRLHTLGAEAMPRLREVAAGEGEKASTARQLLARLGEEP